ncbi:MAG: glycosyltransferase family 39 protein [Pyrinomonadaceae bacterium]|nr:glycosyltransferase family 39 protein [Pyrinomonadaceae bacterium]
MHRFNLAKHAWLALFLLVALVYFYGLGRMPFVGPDEPRYAQVAREMYLRKDFITPTLGGYTWFEKPALLYWLIIAGYKLFGISEFAARVFVACAGLMIILVVGLLARRVESKSAGEMDGFGLTCASVVASSLGIIVFAHAVSFDLLLTLTVAVTLAAFFLADLETEGRRRNLLLILFYAGIGFALLAKGLVGGIIPCGVIALYYVLRWERPPLSKLGIWWGWLLTTAIAAIWYAPVTLRHGWPFIDEFFVQHHFARYVSNKYLHPQPFYFYLPVMLALALPWPAFLVEALVKAKSWQWRRQTAAAGKLRLFALAWLVWPVLFFSLSGSKLPGYILPALPGAALLIGERVAKYARGEGSRWSVRATGALLIFAAAGAIVYAGRTNGLPLECAVIIAVPLIMAGVINLLLTRLGRLCVVSIVVATFAAIALIVFCAADEVAREHSVRDLINHADARGYSSAPVLQLHHIERTAEFYAAGRLTYLAGGRVEKLENPQAVLDALRKSGAKVALVIVPVEYIYQLRDYAPLEVQVIGDNGAVALVAVKAL